MEKRYVSYKQKQMAEFMKKLPTLIPGDRVEVIAPASRPSVERIDNLKKLLSSWQLNSHIPENLLGDDLLCSNADDIRFKLLHDALLNPSSKAIVCVTGGYGCTRLIPLLTKINVPNFSKIFVGMSDMTALNIFLQQKWQWPVIHGSLALKRFSDESIAHAKAILFGDVANMTLQGKPLNAQAEQHQLINSSIVGGNLSLVQASIGTLWQLDARNKILFLEEVHERGFRVDRMLQHLQQANIFADVKAIVFGDFIDGNEPNGKSLLDPVLKRFAESCTVPVVSIQHVGHGHENFPLLLGTNAQLQLGQVNTLTYSR